MNSQIIKDSRLAEEYLRVEHPSGLTMLLYPMKGFSTAYAMFSTKYGSIDTCFQRGEDADFVKVPEGIAHYLEHKMFESEEGDAFEKYAQTGASANAFTSFDKTCYLFACTDRFQESLEILLDCVTHPYFTKETVEKEQGIIGPIAQIDAELLYRCYHTFYNLHNMVLTIAGNFDPQQVIESADKILKPAEPFCVQRKTEDEPAQVCRKRFVQHLPVAVPMFYIGFKGPNEGERQNFCNMLMDEMIVDIVTGETTELYKQLYNDGLINGGIIGETMPGRDYLCSMISGESRDPDQVYERICAEFERVKQEGINQKTFEQVKKSTYGRYLGLFSKPESLASAMNNCYFAGLDVYELVEMVASTTKEQLEQRLKRDFCTEYSSLSIVMA